MVYPAKVGPFSLWPIFHHGFKIDVKEQMIILREMIYHTGTHPQNLFFAAVFIAIIYSSVGKLPQIITIDSCTKAFWYQFIGSGKIGMDCLSGRCHRYLIS